METSSTYFKMACFRSLLFSTSSSRLLLTVPIRWSATPLVNNTSDLLLAQYSRFYSTNKLPPSDNYRFTKSHEWVSLDNNTATVGVSDHAQDALGDAVYVELPELDEELAQGDVCGTVESVKAAADLYSPVSGTVIETNDSLSESPDNINHFPYTDGWILKMKVSSSDEYNKLMTAQEYQNFLNESD